jgi:hypothetical protein
LSEGKVNNFICKGGIVKKVVVFVSMAAILISGVVGCKSTPAATTQTVTGTIVSVNTPAQPGPDQITIQTPAGLQQSFTVDPTSNISLDGFVCPIEQVGQAVSTPNGTFNCTIVYDETYHAISAGVYKVVPPAK